ncbi:hypothetical protein V6N11_060442 [Hibiscus sabdariffa]|uniref:Uncharacterized protein n=1 Tax=Hibiscus sabdariffa TaxID=183260 RepID=A0ABR2QQC4_9ROSI
MRVSEAQHEPHIPALLFGANEHFKGQANKFLGVLFAVGMLLEFRYRVRKELSFRNNLWPRLILLPST